MEQSKGSTFFSPVMGVGLFVVAIFTVLFSLMVCASLFVWYTETKGPFKNWTQVVDWEPDGDLDVIVSHTRWEDVDLSWAGIGRWINQGDGNFELIRGQVADTDSLDGFAAAVGDVDQDEDADIFTQDFAIHLQVNQGGLQEGQPGKFKTSGGINSPLAYNQGYRDMGGTITIGDLNADGSIDAFIAGCCYGVNPKKPDYDFPHAPSMSWVWLNDGRFNNFQTGHIIPLDSLDGRPIRQAALGDLDRDGDLDVFAAVGMPTMGTIDSPGDLLLLNDGTGRLLPFNQSFGETDSTSVALGDVNGDGYLDALVGTNTGASLWINQGHRPESDGLIFHPAQQTFTTTQSVSNRLKAGLSAAADKLLGVYLPYGSIRTKAVFLEDLDGDGDLDALLARLWGTEIWWNDGLGAFRRSEARFNYREDSGVAVADFDGDGDQDIFVGRNENDYQVWWNDGSGQFTAVNE